MNSGTWLASLGSIVRIRRPESFRIAPASRPAARKSAITRSTSSASSHRPIIPSLDESIAAAATRRISAPPTFTDADFPSAGLATAKPKFFS